MAQTESLVQLLGVAVGKNVIVSSKPLEDRVIAIAGVGGGLGPLVARQLADAGATVAGTDRNQGTLDSLAADSSASRPSAGTAARWTCSTRTRCAGGARRWLSASGASTG